MTCSGVAEVRRGGALSAIVETHRRTIETANLESRIAALEAHVK
jgi:hypothetical protein